MLVNELERLKAVNRFLLMDLSIEKELQEIVQLAAHICKTPSALITLIGEDKQFIKFKQAFEFTESLKADAFCLYTIHEDNLLIVEDTLLDQRFINNPFVTGEPKIRFYAGAPLITSDGYKLGSLCVVDQVPKLLTALQEEMLSMLAKQIIQLLEFDSGLDLLKVQFKEAKATEVKLRSFFESSTSQHIMIDKEYKIVFFNKRLQEFVKQAYQINISPGMGADQFIHQNYMADFLMNCKKALSGECIRHERMIIFGGNSYWHDITYHPARNSEGEIIGISYNSTDITNTIMDEHNLVKHQELLNQIAFIQSHELRKPVSNIMGLLTLLEFDGFLEQYKILKEMQNTVNLLDAKINLIVSYASTQYKQL